MILRETKSHGRGLVIEFQDSKNNPCYIQHSSCIDPSIWIGVNEYNPLIMKSDPIDNSEEWIDYSIPEGTYINTGLHLSQDYVKGIIPILFDYAYTGELKMNAKLYNNVFSDTQLEFINNIMDVVINEEKDKINKYGFGDEATAGADDVIIIASGIKDIINNKRHGED